MMRTLTCAALATGVAGHGWLVQPMSKNDLENKLAGRLPEGMPGDFENCPHCSANGNNNDGHLNTLASSCGGTSDVYARGLEVWQEWYDAAGLPVPVLTPGSDLSVAAEITADHGGQWWIMIACATQISEDLDWTYLERAASDRDNNFLPSNPGIYAWNVRKSRGWTNATYHVPDSFSCPSGVGVGRWLWKTGNSCNDYNNVGRSTQTFLRSENEAVGSSRSTCTQAPETFIACFDFKLPGTASASFLQKKPAHKA